MNFIVHHLQIILYLVEQLNTSEESIILCLIERWISQIRKEMNVLGEKFTPQTKPPSPDTHKGDGEFLKKKKEEKEQSDNTINVIAQTWFLPCGWKIIFFFIKKKK